MDGRFNFSMNETFIWPADNTEPTDHRRIAVAQNHYAQPEQQSEQFHEHAPQLASEEVLQRRAVYALERKLLKQSRRGQILHRDEDKMEYFPIRPTNDPGPSIQEVIVNVKEVRSIFDPYNPLTQLSVLATRMWQPCMRSPNQFLYALCEDPSARSSIMASAADSWSILEGITAKDWPNNGQTYRGKFIIMFYASILYDAQPHPFLASLRLLSDVCSQGLAFFDQFGTAAKQIHKQAIWTIAQLEEFIAFAIKEEHVQCLYQTNKTWGTVIAHNLHYRLQSIFKVAIKAKDDLFKANPYMVKLMMRLRSHATELEAWVKSIGKEAEWAGVPSYGTE